MDYLDKLNLFRRRRNPPSDTTETSTTGGSVSSPTIVLSPASPSAGEISTTSSSGEPSGGAGGAPEKKRKKKTKRKRTVSVVPISEVTEASLELWRTLPTKIRQDPSMVSFQQVELEHARLHGEYDSFFFTYFCLNGYIGGIKGAIYTVVIRQSEVSDILSFDVF